MFIFVLENNYKWQKRIWDICGINAASDFFFFLAFLGKAAIHIQPSTALHLIKLKIIPQPSLMQT